MDQGDGMGVCSKDLLAPTILRKRKKCGKLKYKIRNLIKGDFARLKLDECFGPGEDGFVEELALVGGELAPMNDWKVWFHQDHVGGGDPGC